MTSRKTQAPDNYHRFPDEVKENLADPGRYLNANIRRWCALCGTFESQMGGTLRHVLGGRHWVCVKHKKVK